MSKGKGKKKTVKSGGGNGKQEPRTVKALPKEMVKIKTKYNTLSLIPVFFALFSLVVFDLEKVEKGKIIGIFFVAYVLMESIRGYGEYAANNDVFKNPFTRSRFITARVLALVVIVVMLSLLYVFW